MPVSYLELENFKSYSGTQRIGPFHDFTCVIGPNGSGKSNLMDAISFVLGVQSKDLRSSQMKDLIFRPPGITPAAMKRLKASATLVYVDPEDQEETRFSRTVSPNGVGDYRINNKVVPYAKYEEGLGEIGILVKARNFLVFQGDVESIARKSPKQLVEMFENISNSAELRDAYDEALKAKEEAESATVFAYNRQKGFKSERRQLKDQKDEAERFHETLEDKSRIQTNFFLWQLFHIHGDIGEREEAAEELNTELVDAEKNQTDKSALLKSAKKKASAARRATGATDKARVKLAAEVDKLQPDIIKSTEEIKKLKKQVASDEKKLEKIKNDAELHGETLSELEGEIKEYTETEEKLQSDYDLVKSGAGEQQPLTEDQEAEFERVKEAAAVASAKPRQKLNAENRRLESARASAANITNELQEVRARRDEANQSVTDLKERKATLSQVCSNCHLLFNMLRRI
jgi:structural maintenance of chromosome 1